MSHLPGQALPPSLSTTKVWSAIINVEIYNNKKKVPLTNAFFIRPWLFLIHLGLKHCHILETINTSVLVAALNMSLPEARSLTPHYPGPQEPSFMLIRPSLLQKTLAVHYAVNKQGDTALNP